MTVEPRDLSAHERALLWLLLRSDAFPGAEQLASQVDAARVVGGLPTLLDLEVRRTSPASSVANGPALLRAYVESLTGEIEGELLVWIVDGYLSGLEFAWYTDTVPEGMPSPDRVRVG